MGSSGWAEVVLCMMVVREGPHEKGTFELTRGNQPYKEVTNDLELEKCLG